MRKAQDKAAYTDLTRGHGSVRATLPWGFVIHSDLFLPSAGSSLLGDRDALTLFPG